MKKEKIELLPSYSELGGYEINYLQDGYRLLCSGCANELQGEKLEQYIHWEGGSTYCDECSYEIESVYGEPENS